MPLSPPPGSSSIAQWSAARGLVYEPRPEEAWFRRWEPHDTIAPPSCFFNSCTWMANPGHVVLVEPWYAPDEMDPLDRTVIAFAVHPGFVFGRAAIRVEEHFLTRVAYIESPPPPEVTLGDAVWDAHVKTFAADAQLASRVFHPRLRKLLVGWGFKGHLEIRPGGLVVHYAGLRPTPGDYDRLLSMVQQIVSKAVAPYPAR